MLLSLTNLFQIWSLSFDSSCSSCSIFALRSSNMRFVYCGSNKRIVASQFGSRVIDAFCFDLFSHVGGTRRFLPPIETSFEEDCGINVVALNPLHSLIGLAGADGTAEFRDPRAPQGLLYFKRCRFPFFFADLCVSKTIPWLVWTLRKCWWMLEKFKVEEKAKKFLHLSFDLMDCTLESVRNNCFFFFFCCCFCFCFWLIDLFLRNEFWTFSPV